jgi:hypothetical protein
MVLQSLTLKELGRMDESANAFIKLLNYLQKITMYQLMHRDIKNYDNSSLSRKGIIRFHG